MFIIDNCIWVNTDWLRLFKSPLLLLGCCCKLLNWTQRQMKAWLLPNEFTVQIVAVLHPAQRRPSVATLQCGRRPSDFRTGGGIASLPVLLLFFYWLPDDSTFKLLLCFFKPVATTSVWIVHFQQGGEQNLPNVPKCIIFFHFLNLLNGRIVTLFLWNVKFPGCCSATMDTDATSLCSQLDFSIFHYTLARSQCKYPAVALASAPAVVRDHLCGLSLC